MKYRYGDSWETYPIESGEVWGLANGSRVAVHDIFDPLPGWMRADLVFVDPPYNAGQLLGYYTKAGAPSRGSFGAFMDALFRCFAEIGAHTVYVEASVALADEWHERLARHYAHVQRWPVTYYHRAPASLLRGSNLAPTGLDYSGMDEADCIVLLGAGEEYECLADPCMGRGLAGLAAYRAGRRFVGTELNKRRLAVLLDRLAREGARVMRLEGEP